MPNSRHALQRVEHVAAVIEADCGNARNRGSVRKLLILNWVMEAPTRASIDLKGALRCNADLCADGE